MTSKDYTTNACALCKARCDWSEAEEWEEPPAEVLRAAAELEEARSKLREELTKHEGEYQSAVSSEDLARAEGLKTKRDHLRGQIKIFGELADAIRSEDFARASMLQAKCHPSKPLPQILNPKLIAVLSDGSSNGLKNVALALLMDSESGGLSLQEMQEIASSFGDHCTQDIGTEDPAFDKFGFVRNKGGGKFEFTADSMNLLLVTGVPDGLAARLNGLYGLTSDVFNGKPLFRKQRDDDAWLLFTKGKKWCFTDTQSKDANDNMGCCFGVEKGIDHPAQVISWKCLRDDKMEVNASMKCTSHKVGYGFVHGEQKLTPQKPYFEVTLLQDCANGVGIGLSCDSFFAGSMVGWGSGSIGYHSHDGRLHYQGTSSCEFEVTRSIDSDDGDLHYQGTSRRRQKNLAIQGVSAAPFGPTSKAGDTIGCGILFDASDQPATIFFTRNKGFVGRVPFPSQNSGMHFPVVSSASPAMVQVNLAPATSGPHLHQQAEPRQTERINRLRNTKELTLRSNNKDRLPTWLGELAHLEILRVRYPRLGTLEDVPFECLIKLRILDLQGNSSLKELPAKIRSLTKLEKITLKDCDALHTPPKHVVEKGTVAILAFLGDLSKGDAVCHLIKLVLLGDQRAGKRSLAESLMLGRPATRSDSDRTVGIDVRRWPVGGKSKLVINIFDAAGQRVYRATHGLFMSEGALFLHVVRSDMTENNAVVALLEWVEMVQQVSPGAIMAVVWTHIDRVSDLVLHSKVLTRVHEKIKRQVQDVHEALERIENEIADAFEAQHQKRKWQDMCTQRDAAFEKLDAFAMAGCTAKDSGEIQSESEEEVRQRIEEALTSIKARHGEMQELENGLPSISQGVVDGQSLGKQLERLRQWRMQRPRILCSRSVSSFTGEGLPELRCALTALMEDRRLFPHVGARVPLNYLMLERLAQEGRAQTVGEVDHDGASAQTSPATISSIPKTSQWEMAITKHVAAQEIKSPGLRKVCENPLVRLDTLEDAAKQVGMDRKEVMRALQFLHKTGSVLHYTAREVEREIPETRRHSLALQNTVFMRPDFIIDAIKCVIRESSAKDVNDEVRKKDDRIRGRQGEEADREALDRFLGWSAPGTKWEMVGSEQPETGNEIENKELSAALQEGKVEFRKEEIDNFKVPDLFHDSYIKVGAATYFKTSDAGQHGSGVLTKRLLTRHLWRDFDPEDHTVLLELMKAFKLLRPLPLAEAETFLVPALLPRSELPPEYTSPHWWCPSIASAAAIVSATQRPAVMRVMYEVLGGSLPFGFMSELQVLLSSQQHTKSSDQETYFAPETAVVDRIFGSVLSDAYTYGGNVIKEWVILSRPRIGDVHASGSMRPAAMADCIRIVGWVEVLSGEGGSDWKLLERVIQEIERMQQRALGLCFQKKAFFVDARGKLGTQLLHTWGQLETKVETLRFEFENGSTEDVDRQHVLPSGSEMKVVKTKNVCARDGTLHRVDAFFAKQKGDHSIDVHAEAQMMTRIVMDAGG